MISERPLADGWRWVRFGDVVRQVKQTTKDPEADGLTRIVGLEHLDSESLPIRRWKELDELPDGTSFTRFFRAGQVLFGKRRAYQRKVGVPDFDGVCSGDILVFEPSTDALLPEFLPHVVQSDSFFAHALDTSAGSLSPRTNWKSLADYVFCLPPRSSQSQIAEVMDAALSDCSNSEQVLAGVERLRASTIERTLFGLGSDGDVATELEHLELPTGWRFESASDVCVAPVTSGRTPRNGQESASRACPFIKVGHLTLDGDLQFDGDETYLNREAFEDTKALHVLPGDVLTNIVGPPLGKVSVVPRDFPEAMINQAIVRFRPRDSDWTIWISAYLMTQRVQRWLYSQSKKTSGQRNINATTCAALPIVVPPPTVFKEIVEELVLVDRARALAERRVLAAHSLRLALRAGLVEGGLYV